jgi:hypothetical protein
MPKEQGLGMGAFFAQRGEKHPPAPELSQPTSRVRTSITLTTVDAERLELLRMQLRRRQGRGLTYSDVVALALQRLAESEPVSLAPPVAT